MPVAIYINQLSTVSALGNSRRAIDRALASPSSCISEQKIGEHSHPVAKLDQASEAKLEALVAGNRQYARLDRSTLMALEAADGLMLNTDSRLGINIGSSRGATGLLENYIEQFLEEGQVSPYASPTTTAGNISSWVGQHLGAKGVRFDQSVTCSTALHGVLNAVAWLNAGMADLFVVGGTEAALTPFTLAQMQALKLIDTYGAPQCRSMDLDKQENSMVLGEGAGLAVLSKEKSQQSCLKIVGIGWATELISHPSSLSPDAKCFQQSMQAALHSAELQSADAIVLHAPGTVLGDKAEFEAIKKVFDSLPFLTSNKWKVGHTFAASGMISLEQAYWMLRHDQPLPNPFFTNTGQPKHIKSVLINAVGFGGNAVSLIVEKA